MKPRILVTREVFHETLAFLAQSCDVDSNQEDVALSAEQLARRPIGITVQVDEGPEVFDAKISSLHPLFTPLRST